MSQQPNRLGTGNHHLQGSAIDRSKPLQFRLDGRLVSGFAGDTVLSALLASGIDTAGRRDKAPLALSSRHAPAIVFSALMGDQQRALPMARTPASDGADYLTIAPRSTQLPFLRWLGRGGRSLGLDLDRPDALAHPWQGQQGEPGPAADLIVVGGGVAGMAAALAAAEAGQRVVLIESTPLLGGKARLFGTQDGEETPDQTIERQTAAIARNPAITVLTHAEVFALRPGRVRLHQVDVSGPTPAGRVIDIAAPHIVLATGALERLPLFPGNRLPGVAGALEAFELAQLYGVWPGRSALFATSSSPAYRLAMLASDAGITIPRIIDSRPQPQSRFIEFSKAYGITQAAGTIVASATPAPRGRSLLVSPQLAMEGLSRDETILPVDRLIACGGWQPDLTLWHMAGGESAWQMESSSLQPTMGPAGIALAGSAAGWITRRACLASGADAVNQLLGRPRMPVEDLLIDPIYETPDAPAAIGAAPDKDSQPVYLDAGRRYIERPRSVASRWPDWLGFLSRPAGWSLADTPQPLDIADIAAGVQLGAIPPASAGIVAQERVGMVLLADDAPEARPDSAPLELPPDFLLGRYADAGLFRIAPVETRQLDVGALIYDNPDETDPLKAIGVVVRISGEETIALVSGTAGQAASLREPDRAVAITLVAPYGAEAEVKAQ